MTPALGLAVLQLAASPAPTVHASADDCAVIVGIGKAELGWSANSAGAWPFFPTYDLDGGGTYVEDCPWRALGVAPPAIGALSSARGSAITRPVFADGGMTATAELTTTIAGKDASGRPVPPFIEDRVCKLERRGNTWQVVSCDTAAIT